MVSVWLSMKTVLTLAILHCVSILQPVNMGAGINTRCFSMQCETGFRPEQPSCFPGRSLQTFLNENCLTFA